MCALTRCIFEGNSALHRLEDGAHASGALTAAADRQTLQHHLDPLEIADLLAHILQFCGGLRTYVAAVAIRIKAKLQKLVDLSQREPKLLCPLYETDPLDVALVIDATVTARARRLRDKTALLVVAAATTTRSYVSLRDDFPLRTRLIS